MEFWNLGVMEFYDGRWKMGDGVLEWWNLGVMEFWNLGVMEFYDKRWVMEEGGWKMFDGRWKMGFWNCGVYNRRWSSGVLEKWCFEGKMYKSQLLSDQQIKKIHPGFDTCHLSEPIRTDSNPRQRFTKYSVI